MARTLAQLDAAVTALETWRTATVDPSLAQARTAITNLRADVTALEANGAALAGEVGALRQALETLRDRLRASWRALVRGRVEGLDGEAGALQPAFSAEELRVLRWLINERGRVSRR